MLKKENGCSRQYGNGFKIFWANFHSGGPGQTAKYLKDLGIEISGLDLSEKILEQARTIHPEIHFRKGNILELEFENDSIAGAVAFYAIVHFTEEQVEIAFREVFRIL
ncbi:MAG: class I SAM-dependent methyltransferase [Deltaproteobacteria bacterium]|nr:class I SAM-dependent methyltransferase [Deltaproteobacteria bacterium]